MSKIEYEQIGDYQIPKIKAEEPLPILGRFGRAYLEYLKNVHPGHLMSLRVENKLNDELECMEYQMDERYKYIMIQLMEQEGITDEVKENNPEKWLEYVRMLDKIAYEVVMHDFLNEN